MDREDEGQKAGRQFGAQKFSTKAYEMQKKEMQEIASTAEWQHMLTGNRQQQEVFPVLTKATKRSYFSGQQHAFPAAFM